MRIPLYSSLLILLSFTYVACDSTGSPDTGITELPIINSINANPSKVQFTLDTDGYKDTTITVQLEADILLKGSSELPSYVVTDITNREFITSGRLAPTDSNSFTATIDLNTSTTEFKNYSVQIYAFNDQGNSTVAEQNIELLGFSNARPEILLVNNPAEVNRPAEGEFLTQFIAKVTDADGQATIDRVLVRILDIFGADVPDSPFEMFDDGLTYNDAQAADSVYSITFPIGAVPGRETQSFFIEYFAVDQGGIYSDTTRTTFKITNNQ